MCARFGKPHLTALSTVLDSGLAPSARPGMTNGKSPQRFFFFSRTPSIASLYRLEHGGAIRLSHARRVFDVVNRALGNTLDPSKELKMK
jgi:hypothetical protein